MPKTAEIDLLHQYQHFSRIKTHQPKLKVTEIRSIFDRILLKEVTKNDSNLINVLKLFAKSSNKLKNLTVSEKNTRAFLNYLILPLIFLTVTLLGGLRLSAENNVFLFLKPALICLIFAAIILILFFRGRLILLEGWFSEDFSILKNTANGLVLLSLYTASVQLFNSLLPEKGLPFWIIGFFFFWTLWNNLFVDFQAKRLLKSLGSLFGLAFVTKYLVLASLTTTGESTWTQKIFEGIMKEASFGLLDLPKFSSGTGYIQFFTLILYVVGLFLLSPTSTSKSKSESLQISSETTSNKLEAV